MDEVEFERSTCHPLSGDKLADEAYFIQPAVEEGSEQFCVL